VTVPPYVTVITAGTTTAVVLAVMVVRFSAWGRTSPC
jgi:hypothetical protein